MLPVSQYDFQSFAMDTVSTDQVTANNNIYRWKGVLSHTDLLIDYSGNQAQPYKQHWESDQFQVTSGMSGPARVA